MIDVEELERIVKAGDRYGHNTPGVTLELIAEVRALREDAERYRWLRAQHWNESDLAVVRHPKQSVRLGFDCPSAERLDSAIDAARGSN